MKFRESLLASEQSYLSLFLPCQIYNWFPDQSCFLAPEDLENNTIKYCFHFIVNVFNCFSYQTKHGNLRKKSLQLSTPSSVHLRSWREDGAAGWEPGCLQFADVLLYDLGKDP